MCRRGSAGRIAGLLLATTAMAASSGAWRSSDPGHLRWRVEVAGTGIPAANDRTAYFFTRHHEVIAVDILDGGTLWRSALPSSDALQSSALRLGGGVLVAGDGDLFGLDPSSGKLLWRFAPADGYGAGLYVGVLQDGAAFTGSPAGRLYGVELASGRLRWSTLVGTDTTVFEPAGNAHALFAAYTRFLTRESGVVSVALDTGRVRWQHPLSCGDTCGAFAGGLAVAGDLVLAASGDGALHALSATDGAVRWSTPARSPGTAPAPDYRALAVVGRRLVAGSLTGEVAAYSFDEPRELWRYPGRRGSTGFTLAVGDDTIYVPFLSGDLVALNADTGAERWAVGRDVGRFRSAPFVAPEVVLAAGASGLFAFSK
ncbi:MAG: PQQ-like beta-propeller repeat protein [Acidobacteria bacterium]|nr:PQQ-like beta-propeller repeat protein [Acidobacteriota bacterium]